MSYLEMYKPWLLIQLVSSLRLLKISPILNVFNLLKERDLNLWRIVEVITYYYLICHFMACLLLANVAFDVDARDTWLRRIPVP